MAKNASPNVTRRERSGPNGRSARSAGDASSTASRRLARRGSGRAAAVRPDSSVKGNGGGRVAIELTQAQVNEVIRGADDGGTMTVLLSALRAPDWALALQSEDGAYPEQMGDRRLSHSLLSGLLVLSCFPLNGEYLGVADISRMLKMNTSTTHRYMSTLLAVGLIERDPDLRKYRIARI
jgi:IclR-like helix-turn-helix domain-containing protein